VSEPNTFPEANVLPAFIPAIGNALAGVLSATQALLNGAEADPVFRRDLLGAMEANLQYLRFVYENWVVSGSAGLGDLNPVPREIEPSRWLSGFLAPWRRRIQDRELIWEARVKSNHPPIRFDQDLVGLALENLLALSLAAAPAGSQVLVSSGFAQVGGSLWIEISDQGPGLTDESIKKALFALPEEAQSASMRLGDGRYLGLRVASAVARAHAGRLERVDRSGYSCSLRLTIHDLDSSRRT